MGRGATPGQRDDSLTFELLVVDQVEKGAKLITIAGEIRTHQISIGTRKPLSLMHEQR
ncbi:hypothetical protein D3C78_690760 [compost metagenome]